MKKNVVLLLVCCTLVWLALNSEKGGADSIPVAHQETVITSGDSGLQSPTPEGLHHREKREALQTGVGSQSDRPAPDPRSILLFGTGVVAWLMVMKMSQGV